MGLPDRPVVAVLGDGSALFAIQALWSAARYDVGVLLVVMANGGYAVMDALAQRRGGAGAWPGFAAVDIAGIARCSAAPRSASRPTRSCPSARRGAGRSGGAREPLVIEVVVGE